jgi:hypothetical protein
MRAGVSTMPDADGVKVTITLPPDLLQDTIRLGISRSAVARKALRAEVKRRQAMEDLARARAIDPRLTPEDIARPTRRTRRLLQE